MAVVGLLLAVIAGCARQPAIENGDATPANNEPLPFDRPAVNKVVSPTASIAPENIPAGTPVTIRLSSAVSSERSRPGDTFDAVLDEPIIVEGQTLAARGASVSGRVAAAKPSGRLHDPGYLRLTLTHISIKGKSSPLQTSSIFVKGGSHPVRNLAMIGSAGARTGTGSSTDAAGGARTAVATGNKDVGFSPEKRLTFRVTQPVNVQNQ